MDIVRRLATSQARGVNQLSFINELLTGDPVHIRWVTIPTYGDPQTIKYGLTGLASSSWRSVKARLVSVGFVVEEDRTSPKNMFVRLHFPEQTLTTLF